MKRLVLFDIDGTLITCGKAPRRAITQAIEEIFGTRGIIDSYPFSGKTDTRIIYDVMTEAGFSALKIRQHIPTVVRRYIELLDIGLQAADIRILTGVTDLLDRLTDDSRAVIGLLTGNIPEGARIKLERAGLAHYFFNHHTQIGAFGHDSMERHELATLAVHRAESVTGIPFRDKSIVIIGDSPYDIECGRHLNARSIAVATGWHPSEELTRYQPDFLLKDFSDTDQTLRCIFA